MVGVHMVILRGELCLHREQDLNGDPRRLSATNAKEYKFIASGGKSKLGLVFFVPSSVAPSSVSLYVCCSIPLSASMSVFPFLC